MAKNVHPFFHITLVHDTPYPHEVVPAKTPTHARIHSSVRTRNRTQKKNKHPIPNTDIDTCVPDLRPHAWKITAAISCKEPNVVSSLKSSLKTHPVIECEEMFHMTSDRQAKIFGKLVYINQTIPISVYFSKFIQQFLHCIHLHAVRKISKSDRS